MMDFFSLSGSQSQISPINMIIKKYLGLSLGFNDQESFIAEK